MYSFLAVGLGAALGAWLRWGLAMWLNGMHPIIPFGTLAANLLGGYAVGLAIAFFAQHPGIAPEWRLFIITGMLGGLTTFSTFSAELFTLFARAQVWAGLALAGAHLLGSLMMTAFGVWSLRWLRG